MGNKINKVSYTTTNTYETLNELTQKTKNIWIVFHGIGFLSRFFLRYFDELNADENYMIAPQAPSKYYLNGEYKHVGASWLTKENTVLETENLINYINAVLAEEKIPGERSIIVLGFSQGVSIAMRYLAKTQFKCQKLVLYAGGIPNELKKSDFGFLIEYKTEIMSIVGDADEYLTPERLKNEHEKLVALFGDTYEELTFKGGHEVKKEIINNLV
ncbi:alpha/beta hydrolase [Maribacter sp. X9]|uniref:alpha/beta hydrolase n=1 Tax=Maribacter sp. X9 TaxID=3402159 RepID=UPI003AF3B8A3